jgi:hypothetical protein
MLLLSSSFRGCKLLALLQTSPNFGAQPEVFCTRVTEQILGSKNGGVLSLINLCIRAGRGVLYFRTKSMGLRLEVFYRGSYHNVVVCSIVTFWVRMHG